MTAPVPASTPVPAGTQIPDGFSTLVTIGADTDISLWQREVTPPPLDGGEKIDQTTMHNEAVMTALFQSLYEVGDMTLVCGYDPRVIAQILAIKNVNTTITVTFPDSCQFAFFGAVRSFTPQNNVKGTKPLANVVISASNIDPVSGDEEEPVFKSAAGTTLYPSP
jgi:hypothetical protein